MLRDRAFCQTGESGFEVVDPSVQGVDDEVNADRGGVGAVSGDRALGDLEVAVRRQLPGDVEIAVHGGAAWMRVRWNWVVSHLGPTLCRAGRGRIGGPPRSFGAAP